MNIKFFLLILFISITCNYIQGYEIQNPQTVEARKSFLYFSYGSNLKTSRIHKNNPSAKYVAIGKIKDYRLDFIGYASNWHGSPSTIVPTKNSTVWGVVWEIDTIHLLNLDDQEGVDTGEYIGKTVNVQLQNGDELECRTYQQTQLPDKYVKPNELPLERQPSPGYMNVVIDGAKEHNLPKYYLEFLKSFRHNNYQGPVVIL